MFSTQDAMRPAPGKNNMIYKKENISGIENLTDVRLAPNSLTILLILNSFYKFADAEYIIHIDHKRLRCRVCLLNHQEIEVEVVVEMRDFER